MSLKNDLLSYVKGHRDFISYEGTYTPKEILLKFRDIPYCEYLVFRFKKGTDEGILFVAVNNTYRFHNAGFDDLAPTVGKCWWQEDSNGYRDGASINRDNFDRVKEFYI